MIPKKFLQCCEASRPFIRLPNLEIQQKDWESLGHLTFKDSNLTGMGERETIGGHKQNLVTPGPRGKEQ